MRVRPSSLVPSAQRGCASPNETLIAAAVFATVAASVSAQVQFIDATATRMPPDTDWTFAVALGDVDGDDDPDLVFGNANVGGRQNRLYLNDGHGVFTDATAARMPLVNDRNFALALGDVDGDGDADLVVGNDGQNRLYLNDGTGTFTDVTAARLPTDNDVTSGVALGDVDGDGDADLVFGNNYGFVSGWPNRLYLNDGTGTFVDVTAARLPPNNNDLTLAVTSGDVDGDGDVDLIFGNEALFGFGGQTKLYLNDGTGTFTDATATHMPVNNNDETEAVALGDVDGDGDSDLVLGNVRAQNRLYLNDGLGRFTDVTATHKPAIIDYTTSVALGDIDGDGDPDLVFGNSGKSRLYVNNGHGGFTNTAATRIPINESTRALALGDVDGDGDPDVVVGNDGLGVSAQNRLYLNLLRQLDAPFSARLGHTYRLDIYARYGAAAKGDLGYPLLASATANSPLLPFGTLFLDPSTMVALPPLAIPQPAGVNSLFLVVPNLPSVIGVPVYAQALLIQYPAAYLTNLTANRILP